MVSRNADRSKQGAPTADAEWQSRNLFFETISQEIRRPLDGVLAVTELLQRQPLSADAQAYVRTIVEQHQALIRTLADAADIGRSATGKLELTLEPVELRPLMDAIQEEWGPKALQGGVTLSVSYDGDELLALIDAPRLRQVFNNMIDRALRLTRRGGVEASLRARREASGLMIEGRVRDSAPVMEPEKLAHIFELTSKEEGAMTMVLSRRLVEAMNGSIRAESNIGSGSTVGFDFVAEEAQASTDGEANRTTARTAHVLVVDDNATNRMVAEALCEMFDCTSETAEDGIEAVEAAKSGRFDLILMDIKMPRMDGVEATQKIRAMSGRAGTVPIIALTANADPDDALSYLACGMSSVVEKPIKPEALLAAMNACLPEVGEDAAPAPGRAAAA